MKPKFRKEAGLEFHHQIVTAAYIAVENSNEYPFQSCINCLNFKEDQEICFLANQRPPAKVIVFGCQMHEDIKDIPF